MDAQQPRLIGIGHRKQQGKDTLAKYLQQVGEYTTTAFAKPLKDLAMGAFGLSWAQVNGTNEQKDTMTRVTKYHLGIDREGEHSDILTAREVLQLLGVRMREEFPHIWVNAPFRGDVCIPCTGDYIITDLRFPDELDKIGEEDGVTVRVRRPGHDLKDLHASETALDGHLFDIEVLNNGEEIDLLWAANMIHALTSAPLSDRIELNCKSKEVRVL